jgi:glycosyltransferase involved in cell wall biosynthesis
MDGGRNEPTATAVRAPEAARTQAQPPLRILYHHRVRSRDGQAVHIDELVAALRGRGHSVDVVAPPGYDAAPMGAAPERLDRLKARLPKWLYETLELAYNVPALWRLWRAHRRLAPDVIYERCNLYLLAGTVLSALTGTPLLLEVNAPLAQERARHGGLGLPRLAAALERLAWRRAACVLPVTGVLAAELTAAGVTARRILVVPNGIDLERFGLERFGQSADDGAAIRQRLGLDGRLVLGFTGFMRDWHGLDTVVDMLAAPGTPAALHLLLVGDGPARRELERQAERLGVRERVTITGSVERERVTELLGAVDIALQPRAVAYASPLKLVEYMAAGKAIVAPDQPNIREVLDPDATALLYDPGAPATMVAAILRLAGDPALRRRLGQAARQAVVDRDLTWRHNAERIADAARGLAQAMGHRR